jgi:hypothetical protein
MRFGHPEETAGMRRGSTRYTPPQSKGEAALRCLFWSACSIALGCLTYGVGFLMLPFVWWLFLSEIKDLSGPRNQTQRPIKGLPADEPSFDHKHFRQWLEKRIQSVGYTLDTAPGYLKDAYKSGNPKDLNQLVWQEWWSYSKTSNKTEEPPVNTSQNRDGLYSLPIEDLATLPDWMIPPDRKSEVELFNARKRREALDYLGPENPIKPQTKPGERMEDPRGYWEPRNKGGGGTGTVLPQEKRGPRGGRYTEGRTKDGRPYRRYF